MALSWVALSLSKTVVALVADLWWLALFCAPAVGVVSYIIYRRREYDREAAEPFQDALLRSPGESTRLMAESHFERCTDRLGILALASTICGTTVANTQPDQRYSLALLVGVMMLIVCAFTVPVILRSMRLYWNFRLGSRGERLVGEQLNPLWSRGFHVFHDLQFEGYNIDHALVGAAGVFAIETKTRRKWRDRAKDYPDYRVRFDGERLTWPSGQSDRFGLDQTLRNARSLSEWLTQATGEPVTCRPILTLPGWFIERDRSKRAEVAVIATKSLSRYLAACTSSVLTPAQVRRIAYQLESRSRVQTAKPVIPDKKRNAFPVAS